LAGPKKKKKGGENALNSVQFSELGKNLLKGGKEMKKIIQSLMLVLFIFVAAVANAQGIYTGGGVSQYQYAYNEGVPVTTVHQQYLSQYSETGVLIDNDYYPIAGAVVEANALMFNAVNDISGVAYTATSNAANVAVSIDTGLTIESNVNSSANAMTCGDASAAAYSDTDMTMFSLF